MGTIPKSKSPKLAPSCIKAAYGCAMGDEFLVVQAQIETVLTLLKATDDADVRRTYLLEFRVLLEQADKLLVTESEHRQPRAES